MAEFQFSYRQRPSEPESLDQRASKVYVPKHYESQYAYPLLVLFHGRGGDENQLLRLMPKLSNRNYMAVSLQGPEAGPARRDGTPGFGWSQAVRGARGGEGVATLLRPRMPQISEASSEFLAEYVTQAVADVRTRFNIQTRKIFLVGYGEGAAAAYRLGLGMPGRFAGIVAINGWLPRTMGPLIWLPQARRIRVLITHGRDNRIVPVSAAEQAFRLLLTAGIDSELQILDSGHRIHQRMLRVVNEWLMESFGTRVSASPSS